MNAGEIGRRFESRENRVRDLASRNFLFTVAVGNVTRPEAHVLAIRMIHGPKKNNRVAAFESTDTLVPKDFHEIAGLRLREIGKVAAEPKFMK